MLRTMSKRSWVREPRISVASILLSTSLQYGFCTLVARNTVDTILRTCTCEHYKDFTQRTSAKETRSMENAPDGGVSFFPVNIVQALRWNGTTQEVREMMRAVPQRVTCTRIGLMISNASSCFIVDQNVIEDTINCVTSGLFHDRGKRSEIEACHLWDMNNILELFHVSFKRKRLTRSRRPSDGVYLPAPGRLCEPTTVSIKSSSEILRGKTK